MIDIVNNFDNEKYEVILDFINKKSSKFLFVVRADNGAGNHCREIIKLFDRFLISHYLDSEWYGTKLLSGSADIYLYNLTEESLELLKEISNSFDTWLQPDYPEDLCFLDNNNDPVFVSITNEDIFYFEKNSDEVTTFLESNNIDYAMA